MNWQKIVYSANVPEWRQDRYSSLLARRFNCHVIMTRSGQLVPLVLLTNYDLLITLVDLIKALTGIDGKTIESDIQSDAYKAFALDTMLNDVVEECINRDLSATDGIRRLAMFRNMANRGHLN